MKTYALQFSNTPSYSTYIQDIKSLLPDFEIIHTSDYNEVVSMVRNNNVQIILSEYNPKSSYNILETRDNHFANLPVIYLGNQLTDKALIGLFRMGMHDYLEFSEIDRLPSVVSKALKNVEVSKNDTLKTSQLYNKNLLQKTHQMTKTGIWSFDLKTGSVEWDEILYEIFDADPDFVPNYEKYIGMIFEESQQKAIDTIQQAIENKGAFINEYSINTFKGKVKHIRSWGETIVDEEGNALGMIGVCMDNTEKKNIEDELKAILEMSTKVGGRDYFRTMTNLLCSHFGIKYAMIGEYFPNNKEIRTLGFSIDGKPVSNVSYKLEGTPCEKIYETGLCFYPNNVQQFFPNDPDLKTSNANGYIGMALTKNDRAIGHIILMDPNPLENVETKISILKAIANKSSTEIEQLQYIREVHTYKRFFSVATDLMCIANTQGYFVQVNPQFSKILGYGEDELLHQPFVSFVHPDDAQKTIDETGSLAQGNATTMFTNRYRCKDGSYIHLMWTANIDLKKGLVYAAARDITDLIETREALITTSDRLTNIIEYASVGIAYASNEGRIESLNDKFLEILEYEKKEEVVGMSISDFTHPEDLQADLDHLKQISDGKIDSFELEKRYITRNKKIRWIDLRVSAIRDEEGKVINFVGMVIDITEKKESEKAEKEATKRLKLATNAAKIGIWDWNFVENTLKWDDNMHSIFDVKEGEFQENFEAWASTAHNEDLIKTTVLLEDAIAGNGDFDTQFRIVHKNGEIRHIKANAIVEKNKEGEPYRMIGLNYDITKEVELLKSIEESERRYRSLFERINEGFLLTTSEGIITAVNPSFCEMLEYEINELIGKQGYFLLANKKDIPKLKQKVEERKQGKFDQYDLELKTKKGVRKWFKFSVSPHYNQDGDFIGVMSIVMDITEAKKMERIKEAFTEELEINVKKRTQELSMARKELAQSLEKEKELGNLKSKFVATASHQFRTPLTIIQSSMDILSMQRHLLSEEMLPVFDKSVKRVKGQIEKMVELMNDVLSLGKINEGNIKANKAPLDLLNLCDSIVANYNEIFSEKCKMDMVVEGTPETLVLDEKLMGHAISNLVSNAFKYSPENSKTLFRITYNGDIKISIKDYGIGIPAEAQEALFEPFFRAQNAAYVSGTGLGTTIAKEYVEMNGGNIEVISEVGEGSEFIITLPPECRVN